MINMCVPEQCCHVAEVFSSPKDFFNAKFARKYGTLATDFSEANILPSSQVHFDP